MFHNFKLKISYKTLLACGLFGIVLQILAVYLGFKLIPDFLNDKMRETKELRRNSQQWDVFIKTPFPFNFKIYFFNVNNPTEVLQGAKPVVREIGPYVYKLKRWKSNIEWSNDTEEISYFEHMRLDFDKKASGKYSDEDFVTILNMPYNSFVLTAEATQPEMLNLMNGVLPSIFGENEGVFLKVKVKDFLFEGVRICDGGAEDKGFAAKIACTQVKSKVGNLKTMRVLDDGTILFAMLRHKNMTHQGKFTVQSGKSNKEQAGILKKFNDKVYLSVWNGGNSSCNYVRGVTTIFPADIRKNMIFESFSEDICRTIAMEFKDTQTVKDAKGYVFAALNNSLDSPVKDRGNECFCINKTVDLDGSYGCLGNGLLDLTTCTVRSMAPLWLLLAAVAAAQAKTYDRCGLARELEALEVPARHVPTWVCIAEHESNLNTSAENKGSGDHGLFQISEQYWCSPPGYGCNKPCTAFKDDDISDDVQCIRIIYNEHKRLSGDGFNAWVVYPLYCKGDNSKYVSGCYNGTDNVTLEFNATSTTEEPFIDEDDDGYDFPPLPSPPKQKQEVSVFSTSKKPEENLVSNEEEYEFPPLPSRKPQEKSGADMKTFFRGNDIYNNDDSKSVTTLKDLSVSNEIKPVQFLKTTTENMQTFKTSKISTTSQQTSSYLTPKYSTLTPSIFTFTSRDKTDIHSSTFSPSQHTPSSVSSTTFPITTTTSFNKSTSSKFTPIVSPTTTTQKSFFDAFIQALPPLPPLQAPPPLAVINQMLSERPPLRPISALISRRPELTRAPLIMSFPHLLGADPKYMIEGLKPDLDKHGTFVILEPVSGLPMKVAKRVQFNMFIRPVENIVSTENLTSSLVPIVWIEESTVLDDKFMDIIKYTVLRSLSILNIVRWTFVAIGVILVVLCLVLLIYSNTK